jgi:long-chain fatty acid transport protein
MNSNTLLKTAIAALLPASATLWCASSAQAAGFALMEQNSSGLGNAYAGSAAVADDASTIFFNAAGLTQLKRPSVVVNAAGIYVKSEFKNTSSVAATGQGLGNDGGNAGGFIVLPAFYVAVPLSDTLAGGIGVNAPFGLQTDYDDGWMGRFQGLKSEVQTINVNTALAFKVHDTLSIGVGVDYQTIDATLSSAVNYTAAVAQASALLLGPANTVLAPGLEGFSKVKGSDTAWGFDVGVLFTPTEQTRIGLSYRSAMKYNLTGSATFAAPTSSNPTAQSFITGLSNSTNPGAPTNGPVNLNLKLPASARLALAQKLGSDFDLLFEASWTQWSAIQELRIQRPGGATLKNTAENWNDAWRFAVGGSWQANDAVKLRVGAAWDKTMVTEDATRTPRLPDGDRKWLSAGAKFKVTDDVDLDLGYMHVFVDDADLDQSDGGITPLGYPYGRLTGTQQTKIDILGLQATVSF